jgi:hypothetical protein
MALQQPRSDIACGVTLFTKSLDGVLVPTVHCEFEDTVLLRNGCGNELFSTILSRDKTL